MTRAAPKVSHLFRNNSIIFFKATKEDCGAILDVLELYGKTSGQSINFDKSSFLFRPNVSRKVK